MIRNPGRRALTRIALNGLLALILCSAWVTLAVAGTAPKYRPGPVRGLFEREALTRLSTGQQQRQGLRLLGVHSGQSVDP